MQPVYTQTSACYKSLVCIPLFASSPISQVFVIFSLGGKKCQQIIRKFSVALKIKLTTCIMLLSSPNTITFVLCLTIASRQAVTLPSIFQEPGAQKVQVICQGILKCAGRIRTQVWFVPKPNSFQHTLCLLTWGAFTN